MVTAFISHNYLNQGLQMGLSITMQFIGHFLFKYRNNFYDWLGLYEPNEKNYFVEWDNFDEYDKALKERIIRDCIE